MDAFVRAIAKNWQIPASIVPKYVNKNNGNPCSVDTSSYMKLNLHSQTGLDCEDWLDAHTIATVNEADHWVTPPHKTCITTSSAIGRLSSSRLLYIQDQAISSRYVHVCGIVHHPAKQAIHEYEYLLLSLSLYLSILTPFPWRFDAANGRWNGAKQWREHPATQKFRVSFTRGMAESLATALEKGQWLYTARPRRRRQSSSFSEETLRQDLHECLEADLSIKMGNCGSLHSWPDSRPWDWASVYHPYA